MTCPYVQSAAEDIPADHGLQHRVDQNPERYTKHQVPHVHPPQYSEKKPYHLLSHQPDTNAIIITMVDQPFVDAEHLKKLANAYDPSRPMIIASAYSGTFGVPVLVDNFYFDMLKGLKGDEGGKKIFVNYLKNIVEIPFIEGSIDIDEQKDLDTIN